MQRAIQELTAVKIRLGRISREKVKEVVLACLDRPASEVPDKTLWQLSRACEVPQPQRGRVWWRTVRAASRQPLASHTPWY